jgi:hypothetical protein
MIERYVEGIDGKQHRYLDYDLTFRPTIPKDAVAGDPKKQNFCPLCHTPRYYYRDKNRDCVQCKKRFVFSAKEQKYWYESLGFYFDSVAIRCVTCRKRRRSEKTLHAQIAAAQAKLDDNADDPDALLEDAEARVRCFQLSGEGNLDRAIASASKARRIWPRAAEAHFWEGLAHSLAGRREKSCDSLLRFIESTVRGKRRRSLRTEAQALLSSQGHRE